MTLLGALLDGDLAYLGADLAQMRYDTSSGGVWEYVPLQKPERVGSLPVLWAYYGNASVGEEFRDFVGRDAAIDTWSDLGTRYGPELRRLNGAAGNHGVPAAEALFVGFLADGIGYMDIDVDGLGRNLIVFGEDCHFSGNGRIAAKVGYTTASRLRPEANNIDNFKIAFEESIEAIANLMGPPVFWSIDREGNVDRSV